MWGAAILFLASLMIRVALWHIPVSLFTLNATHMVMLCLFGFLTAQLHSLYAEHHFARPHFTPLVKPYDISGDIIWIEKRARGGVALVELFEKDKPYYVRLYMGHIAAEKLRPTCVLTAKTKLRAVNSPVALNGYDPRFFAFFTGERGQGFIDEIIDFTCPEQTDGWLRMFRFNLTEKLRTTMPADSGAIGAALITGMREAIATEHIEAFRASGLAHMIAISGLHMALFAGTFYGVLRFLGALWPALVLRINWRRYCALLAIWMALFYLLISGGSIATQRAFIMIVIMFFALMVGRPALSLNNISLAAFLILLWQPASLFHVSFQMSFASVMLLIWFYETYGRRLIKASAGERFSFAYVIRKMTNYFIALFLTSLLAGAITGFIAAYHFQHIALFGLIANLLAMPVLGLVVMPAAVPSLLFYPFDSEWPMHIMGYGIGLIVDIAHWARSLPHADKYVPVSPQWVLPLGVCALLFLCLVRGRARFLAFIPLICAAFYIGKGEKADAYILGNAYRVAIRDAAGDLRFLPARRSTYEMRQWALFEGEIYDKHTHMLPPCADQICELPIGDGVAVFSKDETALKTACKTARLIITPLAFSSSACKAQIFSQQDFTKGVVTALIFEDDQWRAIDLGTHMPRMWHKINGESSYSRLIFTH